MNDEIEPRLQEWMRDVGRVEMAEVERVAATIDGLPARGGTVPLWLRAAGVVVIAIIGGSLLLRVPRLGVGGQPYGPVPPDPAAFAGDVRLQRCAGGNVDDVLYAFEMERAADYQRHLPRMLLAPELEVEDPAFVAVYRGMAPFPVGGAPPLPGQTWAPRSLAPGTHELCILVGSDPTTATENIYSGVVITGLTASLDDGTTPPSPTPLPTRSEAPLPTSGSTPPPVAIATPSPAPVEPTATPSPAPVEATTTPDPATPEPTAGTTPGLTIPPLPSGAPGPDPADARPDFVVDVPLSSGATARIRLFDRSGMLIDARAPTRGEYTALYEATDSDDARPYDLRVANGPGDGSALAISWLGTICELEATLTVSQDARTILIGGPPPSGCDAAGYARGLVLSFSKPVPADSISAMVAFATRDAVAGRDFELAIRAARDRYRAGEPIDVAATLEYVGDLPEVAVAASGSGLVSFRLEDIDGPYDMGSDMTTDCVGRVLRRGDAHRVPFAKSGGYGADDPQADFWRSYFSERPLRLPAGPWRLTAIADFKMGNGCVGRSVRLEASVVIDVIE